MADTVKMGNVLGMTIVDTSDRSSRLTSAQMPKTYGYGYGHVMARSFDDSTIMNFTQRGEC